MRLVLDTDVVVAALRSPAGASAELLRELARGSFVLLLSVPLALEYESICHGADHRLASGLSREDVGVFVDTLIAMAEPVSIHYQWRPMLRDAGDEMVLETAVNGQADGLVTFNRRDYGMAPAEFGIETWLPKEALRRIKR
jgi:putative PIN family toxin of toxin-antitoxin system